MDTVTTLGTLTAAEVIDGVLAARAEEHAAAVRQIELAVRWALLHPCSEDSSPAGWGWTTLTEDGVIPLAGTGTPLVDHFAPASLAAALAITLDAARQLIADALELTYRLPRLWAPVLAGLVPVWLARLISRETHDLSAAAVAHADRLISATPDKVRQVNASQLVDEARLWFDPDRAAEDEKRQLEKRGVWTQAGRAPATTEVFMTLDTGDAHLFDQTLNRIAGELWTLGDTNTLDLRRARAVGILADPQHALDLLSGTEGARPSATGGMANLYVHLTPDDLEPETTGAAQIEKLGAATTGLLTDWLARHCGAGGHVNIRPVLDLSSQHAVDQHDPPAAMREHVILRDAHCVFPGCRRDSRSCDLDHITPYLPIDQGGPPGQTRPSNLAPWCRSHHRLKTFTPWDYKRLDQDSGHGTYVWTAPTGHQYDVHPVSKGPPPRRT